MKQVLQIAGMLFGVLLLFTSLNAQTPGWVTQTSGTTNNLNAVFFINTLTGYAAGNSGTILKTTNGGTNWSALSSNVPTHLFAIHFINATTGFIAGDVGTVLKTTNGGSSWATQNSGVPYHLDGIYFSNASTGVICGWYGTIIRTTNGGSSWTQIALSINNNDLNSLSFYDANNGIAAGLMGTIIKTSNGGANWVTQSSGVSISLESVCYLNGTTAMSVGESGNIRKTTNSGVNWNNQSSGTSNVISGVHFTGNNNGVYVGENGVIRRTSNGGTSWTAQTSNTSNWLHAVQMLDSVNAYAVGDGGTIRKTTTGGWLFPAQPTQSAPGNNATCVSLTPAIDWNDVPAPTAQYRLQIGTNANFDTLAIDVSNLTSSAHTVAANMLAYNKTYHWRVMAVNSVGNGPWSATRVFTTKNVPPALVTLTTPANNATAVALTPVLNWNDAASTSSYRVQVALDTAFTNIVLDSSGVAASQLTVPAGRLDNNTVYYWRVNGSNACETSAWTGRWKFTTTVELPIAPVLVSPPDGTVGMTLTPALDWLDIASAESYRIVVSTDSAFTTSVLDTDGVVSSSIIIPAGTLSSLTWYYWRVSAFNEAGTGAWSANWKFQTTLVTGLTQNNNEIPSEFMLAQNYPNPFNPATKIEFALPEKQSVKLDVYSQSGERIASLVNAELPAGSYSYTFDGSKLASGIYYYRIHAGSFTQTKKMLMLK
jgi:photosystem II stability/assembly factor-like uncharacterized protein